MIYSLATFNKPKMYRSLRLFITSFWQIENLYTKKPSKKDIFNNLIECNLETDDYRYSAMLAKFYFEFWNMNDLLNPPKADEIKTFIEDYITEYNTTLYSDVG